MKFEVIDQSIIFTNLDHSQRENKQTNFLYINRFSKLSIMNTNKETQIDVIKFVLSRRQTSPTTVRNKILLGTPNRSPMTPRKSPIPPLPSFKRLKPSMPIIEEESPRETQVY